MTRILLSAVLMSSLLFGQEAPKTTGGYKNGRWWNSIPDTAKVFYISGLADGLSAADGSANLIAAFSGRAPDKPFNLGGYWLSDGVTFGEITKGLDQFYQDPANAAVMLQSALIIFKKRVEGAPPEEIAKEAAEARRFAKDEAAKDADAAKKAAEKK